MSGGGWYERTTGSMLSLSLTTLFTCLNLASTFESAFDTTKCVWSEGVEISLFT